MAITKEKKKEIIKDLKEELKKARIIIFVNFHGLSVVLAGDLRRKLTEISAKYKVAKKTLIRKTMEEFGFEGEWPELEGEVGVAFSDGDPIEPARILKDFAKKHNIKLLGGVFENKYIDADTVVMLANIPAKEVLLGQFVNIINSPIQGMVVALNGIAKNFVRVLNQIHERKI